MNPIFTREEIDFWCNYLGNDPADLLGKVAEFRASGELLTVNEVRRTFKFWSQPLADHPDPAIGNALLDGSACPASDINKLKAIALDAKTRIQANDSNATDTAMADDPKYAKLVQLLSEA